LLGAQKGLEQVQQMLLSQPRLKAHEAFVKNAVSFGKQQNKTSTVGVISLRDIEFLTKKNVAVESPILTISDHLLVGQKAKRHGAAGNAPTLIEWLVLPEDIMRLDRVLWDVSNESMLYLLPVMAEDLSGYTDEFLKLSIRSKNGVMEIVSIFKVQKRAIVDGLNANFYEVIR
ncbi:MAG: phage head morphogenesis protein, partial [Proteobacteria bacterium]|nr:phage head morphogenesis protein [Pseudomonadota bacterium]